RGPRGAAAARLRRSARGDLRRPRTGVLKKMMPDMDSHPKRRAQSGVVRAAVIAVVGVVAILVVLVAVVLGGLATAPGRALLAHAIERNVRSGGLTIALTNLSGWPPFDFGAEKVVLSDATGLFAEIDGLSARLRALPLLTGAIDAEHLSAERVA